MVPNAHGSQQHAAGCGLRVQVDLQQIQVLFMCLHKDDAMFVLLRLLPGAEGT
jgi:hypothetical protein